MSGAVEVDETYIGGKARNMHAAKRREIMGRKANRWAGKVAVLGMLERNEDGPSRVVTMPVADVRQHRLHGAIREHVEAGSSVYTDDLHSYKSLDGYDHGIVNHAHAYVVGKVHTNGMESFWSMLKRALHGTYISVEPFHLFRYLDEQSFRFNTRKWDDRNRFGSVLEQVSGRRLFFKELIGQKQPA